MYLEFKIVEYIVDWGQHYWKAIDCQNKKEINFIENRDGIYEKLGQYPSIQQYVKDEYNIDISLIDESNGNNPVINSEKNEYIWIFKNKKGDEVKIIDIPRTTLRITRSL
jgi:hypothetical protein